MGQCFVFSFNCKLFSCGGWAAETEARALEKFQYSSNLRVSRQMGGVGSVGRVRCEILLRVLMSLKAIWVDITASRYQKKKNKDENFACNRIMIKIIIGFARNFSSCSPSNYYPRRECEGDFGRISQNSQLSMRCQSESVTACLSVCQIKLTLMGK